MEFQQSFDDIEISSGKMFLCDMRLGPSEDGVELSVPGGLYKVFDLKSSGEDNIFRIIKQDSEFNDLKFISKLSTELCLLGCFDLSKALVEFSDFKNLFEWGDGQITPEFSSTPFSICSSGGLKILCFPAGEYEAEHDVYGLYYGGTLIGFELRINDDPDIDFQREVSIDDLFKFQFDLVSNSFNVVVSTEYDEESIFDELKDALLDFYEDDEWERIQQIFSDEEPKINLDDSLSDFLGGQSVKACSIFSVDEISEEKLLKKIRVDFDDNFLVGDMLKIILDNLPN